MYSSKINRRMKEILENKDAIDNPLIKGFLNNDTNFQAFEKAILNPTIENKDRVEILFKEYYKGIRVNAYFTNLIRYYSIDFDKKVRKLKDRYTATLDKPANDNENAPSFKDLITDKTIEDDELIPDNTLREIISDDLLYQALDVLTTFQYQILDLIYVKNLSQIEIAELMNSTPQNISNTHRRSLRKLKKTISERKSYHERIKK